MKGTSWKKTYLLMALCSLVIGAGALLSGCGEDGAQGPAGPAGADAPTIGFPAGNLTQQGMDQLVMTGQVTNVTIASPPVVTFWVKDQFGRGVSGLGVKSTTETDNMRFGLAKLVPGSQGSPDRWVAYTGLTSATSRPSTERNGTIVDRGDGSYTYTFTTNVSTSPTNTWETVYEPSRTHRLVIQISGTLAESGYAITNPLDIIYDFVPAGGTVTHKREIVTTKACNDCHGKLGTTTPHGGRTDTRYCALCHTDQRRIGRTASAPSSTGLLTGSTYIVNGEAQGNFPVMIHKIHKGEGLIGGVGLALKGYDYAGVKFDTIPYPQDITNCRRCHQQSAEAPQGDNWKNRPSRQACGACHDNVSFDSPTPTGFVPHTGPTGTTLNGDFLCVGCHDAAKIEGYHLTVNPTPNNPSVPAGLVNFTYEVSAVTVTNTTQPLITFRILANGTPVTLPTSTTACNPMLTGYSNGPSFLVAYYLPQADGAAFPADYNNLGSGTNKTQTQPGSISLQNICDGTRGVLTGPNASGSYTARITYSAGQFPSGSMMRAVALQGYFTQKAGTAGIAADTPRHSISVLKSVTSDSVRRTVVDSAKCANCHEWFEGHGGNRVYEVQVCVMCHVPNLSSSGRGADPALIDFIAANPVGTPLGAFSSSTVTVITQEAKDSITDLTAVFPTPANPLIYPEAADNMRDLIHRAHAAGLRDLTNPYTFVRDRGVSGVYYYDLSTVEFPGIINLCETCHRPGTYDGTLPDGVLPTTEISGGNGLTSRAAVTAARAAVPAAADIVISPFVGTCIACHDSALTRTHMNQNGATNTTLVDRATYSANKNNETCVLCHSAGRIADPAAVHILPPSAPTVIVP